MAIVTTIANVTTFSPPSRQAAQARITAIRPADYARTRNHLEGAVTGLSPYITHGLVTLPEVLAGVLSAHGPLPVQHKLVQELGWREFFRHAWAHRGDGILQSLHVGPRPDAAYLQEVPADVCEARTGVPAIDQAVRTLYATGYLHNHARMWLASYLVHLRQVHWRVGADWMVAHLLDGDLASNHLSWQWIAGTGSHKPYLFNADNVARFAPADWHSPGTVIDRSYESLESIARGDTAALGSMARGRTGLNTALPRPDLHATPPPGLMVGSPDAGAQASLRGRPVWLVHPWALRPPPTDLPAGTRILGLYLRDHHTRWPWNEARWRWVDAAMAAITPERWLVDAAALPGLLADATQVRTEDDPHISRWLAPVAQIDTAPTLFPLVDRPCQSFSQWWTRAARGLREAGELLK